MKTVNKKDVIKVIIFVFILFLLAILMTCIIGLELDSYDKKKDELYEIHYNGYNIESFKKILEQVIEKQKEEEERKKQEYIEQHSNVINTYLRRKNSPMQGLGIIFVVESMKYNINPYLSVAISGKESYFGHKCFAPFNAWGMLAYPHGFSSWTEGIQTNINWLHIHYENPQSAYDCRGYCIPNQPWMKDVQAIINEMARIQ